MTVQYMKQAKPAKEKDLLTLTETVAEIIQKVRLEGDAALRELSIRFDGIHREDFRLGEEEIFSAEREIPAALKADMEFGIRRIKDFAKAQLESLSEFEKEIYPGIFMGHRHVPIENVGAYQPGGRYPLLSSAQMAIIPAKVAGVKRVVACTPPRKDGKIHPAVIYAAKASGADEIYCMGGAQAIAALAYGTQTLQAVDKIVGPGNQFVTEAKRQVNGVVGLDLQAGPSEVLIIADDTARSDWLAADLLAQAEHDPNARAVLVTTSQRVAVETMAEVQKQLVDLLTADIAGISWENKGEVILVDTLEKAVMVSNDWAPEHLEVHTENPKELLQRLTNYGATFLGELAAVVFADKVSGTNHILPTMGAAHYTGGVWVGTYLKTITHQWVTEEGMRTLAPMVGRQSEIEGLWAHRASAMIRLSK